MKSKNIALWEITNYLYAYTITTVYANTIKVYYQVSDDFFSVI